MCKGYGKWLTKGIKYTETKKQPRGERTTKTQMQVQCQTKDKTR